MEKWIKSDRKPSSESDAYVSFIQCATYMSKLLLVPFYRLRIPHDDILMLFELKDSTPSPCEILGGPAIVPTAPFPTSALKSKAKADPHPSDEFCTRLGVLSIGEIFTARRRGLPDVPRIRPSVLCTSAAFVLELF